MIIPTERLVSLRALCQMVIRLGGWRKVIEQYRATHKGPPDLSYLDVSESGMTQMGFDAYDDHVRLTLRCFDAADLRNAILDYAYIPEGSFKAANLDRAQCRQTNFSGSSFIQASLHKTDVREAIFLDVRFSGTEIAYLIR
ncbi:TPA: hypothetical protein DEP34_01800 [Candidatus Uhrbacteria bacterium]|uniref:Pentapeptide repeat protein n=2 Tax=Candidatus Uhriibacteriota TaxID=1752732 RepID=A0A0G1Q6K3_9BACT|nr:MAG: hypothetical protein UX45_C0011G0025 [Candidatus Uhrbacteria bacterium GW2011_GWF2_46_218]KKU40676.1 MAG: hypothetical protein UX57_C0012G0025 [Candidatus Uhrbacteria bacterium GW2011_GWE2_46_68]HBK34337.1 hypothetical protein [Candidatus Uhrbacteria bacterium]HCB19103.1 hypothetical protein [Candidatus Uhrbacteria bacterium]